MAIALIIELIEEDENFDKIIQFSWLKAIGVSLKYDNLLTSIDII